MVIWHKPHMPLTSNVTACLSPCYFFIPANRHSPPCCRLDTSLLSAGDQGAERRSARKVTRRRLYLMIDYKN